MQLLDVQVIIIMAILIMIKPSAIVSMKIAGQYFRKPI